MNSVRLISLISALTAYGIVCHAHSLDGHYKNLDYTTLLQRNTNVQSNNVAKHTTTTNTPMKPSQLPKPTGKSETKPHLLLFYILFRGHGPPKRFMPFLASPVQTVGNSKLDPNKEKKETTSIKVKEMNTSSGQKGTTKKTRHGLSFKIIRYIVKATLRPKQNKKIGMKQNKSSTQQTTSLRQNLIQNAKPLFKSHDLSHEKLPSAKSILPLSYYVYKHDDANNRNKNVFAPLGRMKRSTYSRRDYDRPSSHNEREYSSSEYRGEARDPRNRYYDNQQSHYSNEDQRDKDSYDGKYSPSDGGANHRYSNSRHKYGTGEDDRDGYISGGRENRYGRGNNREANQRTGETHLRREYSTLRPEEPYSSPSPSRPVSTRKGDHYLPYHPRERDNSYYDNQPESYSPRYASSEPRPTSQAYLKHSQYTDYDVYHKPPQVYYSPDPYELAFLNRSEDSGYYNPFTASFEDTPTRKFTNHGPRYDTSYNEYMGIDSANSYPDKRYSFSPDTSYYDDRYNHDGNNQKYYHYTNDGKVTYPVSTDHSYISNRDGRVSHPNYDKDYYHHRSVQHTKPDGSESSRSRHSDEYKMRQERPHQYEYKMHQERPHQDEYKMHQERPRQDEYKMRQERPRQDEYKMGKERPRQDESRGYRERYHTEKHVDDRRRYDSETPMENHNKYPSGERRPLNHYDKEDGKPQTTPYNRPDVTDPHHMVMNVPEHHQQIVKEQPIHTSDSHVEIKPDPAHSKQVRSSRHNVLFNGVYLPLGYRFSRLFQQPSDDDQMPTGSVHDQDKIDPREQKSERLAGSQKVNLHRSPKSIDNLRAYRRRMATYYGRDERFDSRKRPYHVYGGRSKVQNGYTNNRFGEPVHPRVDYFNTNKRMYPFGMKTADRKSKDERVTLHKSFPTENLRENSTPKYYKGNHHDFRPNQRVKRQAVYPGAQQGYYTETGASENPQYPPNRHNFPNTVMFITPHGNYIGSAMSHPEQTVESNSPNYVSPRPYREQQYPYQDNRRVFSAPTQQPRQYEEPAMYENQQHAYQYHQPAESYYTPVTTNRPAYGEVPQSPHQEEYTPRSSPNNGGPQRRTEEGYPNEQIKHLLQRIYHQSHQNNFPAFHSHENRPSSAPFHLPERDNFMQTYHNTSDYSPVVLVPEYSQHNHPIDMMPRNYNPYQSYHPQQEYIPQHNNNPYDNQQPQYTNQQEYIPQHSNSPYDNQQSQFTNQQEYIPQHSNSPYDNQQSQYTNQQEYIPQHSNSPYDNQQSQFTNQQEYIPQHSNSPYDNQQSQYTNQQEYIPQHSNSHYDNQQSQYIHQPYRFEGREQGRKNHRENISHRRPPHADNQYYLHPKETVPAVMVAIKPSTPDARERLQRPFDGQYPYASYPTDRREKKPSYDKMPIMQHASSGSYKHRTTSSDSSHNHRPNSETSTYSEQGHDVMTRHIHRPMYAAQRKTRNYRVRHLTRHLTVMPFPAATDTNDPPQTTGSLDVKNMNTGVEQNNPIMPEMLQPIPNYNNRYEIQTFDQLFNEQNRPVLKTTSENHPQIITFVMKRHFVPKPTPPMP